MRKARFFLCGLFILIALFVRAQHKISIIIDTDAAIDDLRAITAIFASDRFDVVAISCSDGSLSPGSGAVKVSEFLGQHNLEIPVFYGVTTTEPPSWRALSETISWGELSKKVQINKDLNQLSNIILNSEKPVQMVCLGSLDIPARLIQKDDQIRKNIETIIWYNNPVTISSGSNYRFDTTAANFLLKQDISVEIISNMRDSLLKVDSNYLYRIEQITNEWSETIIEAHSSEKVKSLMHDKHLGIWDDLIAVYLVRPDYFIMKPDDENPWVSYCTALQAQDIKTEYLLMLQGMSIEKHKVFSAFPTSTELFRSDIQPEIDEIIARHGMREWKAMVLTNEMHNHLGIYSIIGAKMGLLALEYFDVEKDQVEVISFAGKNPPLSCLNDGLQCATGATTGQGTLTVAEALMYSPSAKFINEGRSVMIALKPEYKQQVKDDISKGIVEYGNLRDGYWKMIRELGLKYWKEWSREEIFIVNDLKD